MASLIVIVGLVVFLIAFLVYGKWLEKQWGVNEERITPAYALRDDVDYVPAPKIVLFGHHFSSIAGSAPIVGAIAACAFGWLPVAIWCIVACIFIGGVHDFGAIFASVRHGGKSIGEVIKESLGAKGNKLFLGTSWFVVVLGAAAFFDIVASTFVSSPATGTASMLFILWAVIFGYSVNRIGVPTIIASVIGVPLVFFSVWLGYIFPITLSHTAWVIILLIYTAIAMVTPVWLLLQPRDFLSSFLLYAMIVGCVGGIIAYQPSIEMPAFTGFIADGKPLFPVLFVTLACGAVSGAHSVIGSGTTSKQIKSEKDMRIIGYGGMLLEGLLALIAVVTVVFLTSDIREEVLSNGGLYAFSYGMGTFLTKLGIPFSAGQTFAGMALSAFAMTTLDTLMRLARHISQELVADIKPKISKGKEKKRLITNPYILSVISLGCACMLTFNGYEKIWPIFASANQMLAAMALIGMFFWLRSSNLGYRMIKAPMMWMIILVIAALIYNAIANIGTNMLVSCVAAILLVILILMVVLSVKAEKKYQLDK